MVDSQEIVTITGISGYLGAQVCLYFLKNGQYKVRGTVRSKTNEAKIEPLKQAFGEHFDKIELVEADLLNEQSLIQAIQGSTYVVHTASPFPIKQPKDENELIKPAVEGTLAVMRGCKQAGVKRVVITSSCAAIMSMKKDHFTPEDWSDVAASSAYEKSKHLAEKAGWDFIAALPEGEKFEMATVNPGLITGPNLNKAKFSSGDLIGKFMTGGFPMIPQLSMMSVDVRDCAEAHYKALTVPEAAGKRFILVEGTHTMADYAQVLREEFNQYGYKAPSRNMPYFLIAIAAVFDDEAGAAKKYWGLKKTFDNQQTKDVLGIDFIPMKQSLIDMGNTLIETGYIPDKKTKKK